MITIAWIFIAIPIVLVAYAYVGYPLVLALWARAKGLRSAAVLLGGELPMVSVSLPVHNEEHQIRGAIESLLRLDYPADRLQIMVISDASSDATDDIVREFADRGIELLRMDERGGKTAGENAAAPLLRGEIILNTDASIRIHPDALGAMVARFRDSSVGVASGRDVSIARMGEDANAGEAGYVGYEMAIRALETRVGGIIGASGCCYTILPHLHRAPLPAHLSRDFASALTAREYGYRAVSVDAAVCYVPRTSSLRREYHRKVRTMSRGMETLFFKRHLLNPFRSGAFAWMLWSHKIARWAVPWMALIGLIGLGILAVDQLWARGVLEAFALVVILGIGGWLWPEARPTPRVLAIPAYALLGNLAALSATLAAFVGHDSPVWEPTRRHAIGDAGETAST